MLVIFPFEKDFYSKWNYDVQYVGHPLVEVVENFKSRYLIDAGYKKPTIALLPGSRKQEIDIKLPIMLQASKAFPENDFIVAKAPGLTDEFYEPYLLPYKNVTTVSGKTYAVLNTASAALVTSGTATLETALFHVPQVVCYKGNHISYLIARQVIKVKYISLVNLIMDKKVVTELIQNQMTAENCIAELHELLHNEKRRTTLKKEYTDLKNLLTAGGNASKNAAEIIYRMMR